MACTCALQARNAPAGMCMPRHPASLAHQGRQRRMCYVGYGMCDAVAAVQRTASQRRSNSPGCSYAEFHQRQHVLQQQTAVWCAAPAQRRIHCAWDARVGRVEHRHGWLCCCQLSCKQRSARLHCCQRGCRRLARSGLPRLLVSMLQLLLIVAGGMRGCPASAAAAPM